ncbi:MAG: class I SAM-dependent methyltransferase [Tenuifilaceae bacterium]|jgi:2-polyprenyl-3-methyl-5-hydroxy-6-metoxy-1,4-benzoquinol methylase|nr:class I SAM-dependent methyltransferase [Tenuifilaceae bacterium]
MAITHEWDNRYSNSAFIYGLEPNEYFQQELSRLKPGKLLLPGEGEGRNALWAAKKGWEVTAIDSSSTAQQKALTLFSQNDVTVHYLTSDIMHFKTNSQFDAIGLIYVHLPQSIQQQAANRIVGMLKPKGTLIVEMFHPDQIPLSSGGPKSIDMFSSIEELNQYYKELNIEHIARHEVELNEGLLHKGQAVVIRMIAVKP